MIENIKEKIEEIKYEGNFRGEIFCSKEKENMIEITITFYGGSDTFLYNLYSETFAFCREFTEKYLNKVECKINISKEKIHKNERDWFVSTIQINY